MSATAALADLPTVLDPAALMSSVQEALQPEMRDAVSNWVFERVLEGLEAAELAFADAEPEGYAHHRQSYALGRQIAERARNGYQWWMGEKWAGVAAAILGHSVAPDTHAHRALCHNALSAVVRAHDVFEARMAGNYGDAPLPVSAPTAPAVAPPMVTTETVAAVPKPRATPIHAKAPEPAKQPADEKSGKSETCDREAAVTAIAAPSNAPEAAASAEQARKSGEKTELDEAFETALR
ncbi:hypothetical protein [Caenispirillum salinarum]|uniref:hypothetical protein n=1 Tax=Caenispirillum salinarum TaxID=859058 RepID=UPI0005B8269C|nr:hypothetical protein [Caenispirillum salinarum]